MLAIAGLLLAAAAGLAAHYFFTPHATLRVTAGVPGGAAHRLFAAFAATVAVQHPRVRLQPVEVADLSASAKAIEDHAADLAIIRSDAAVPSNGATIAILRRDVVAVVTPAKTSIEKIPNLVGKTIGIPEGILQSYNSQALDTILSYYDIPAKNVQRIFLPMAEIGPTVADKRIAAVLAIGPIGPGEVVDVVNAIKFAVKGTPKIVAIDEAEAINKRFPGFESIDVPDGAFKGRPPVPDDTVTTLAVTYRFVAPNTMFDFAAGAIAQSLFTAKARMMQITPLAAQIEAPDPDDKNPVLPVHPGVANYLNNGVQSFFDEFQNYIYMGGMALSAAGSLIAILIGRMRGQKSNKGLERTDRLIGIADEALRTHDLAELETLEDELNGIVAWCVKAKAGGGEGGGAFSLAISHARYAIEKQRAAILRDPKSLSAPRADDAPEPSGSEKTAAHEAASAAQPG
jgi:TRAP-type uncharacterized transport system substrate-binding protein